MSSQGGHWNCKENVLKAYRNSLRMELKELLQLFESMLNARLQWWLESNQLLSPSQYGFRPGLSTQDVMSRLQHDTLSTSSPHLRIVAGVDVRKAFDSVPHSSVLSMAQQLGITGRAYNFIAAFLEDRTFTVHVGSSHGITHTNRVGVPQGSVLSPVLFNIVLAGLPPHLSEAILRYLEDPQAPPLGSRLLKQYEPIIAAARRLSAPGESRTVDFFGGGYWLGQQSELTPFTRRKDCIRNPPTPAHFTMVPDVLPAGVEESLQNSPASRQQKQEPQAVLSLSHRCSRKRLVRLTSCGTA
ncbi:hypothetical protein ISCGN_013555 [Ixodes scapularis]